MDSNGNYDQEFVNGDTTVPVNDDLFNQAAEQYGKGNPAVFARLLRGMYAVESDNGRNTNHVDPVTGKPSGARGPLGLSPAVIKKFGVSDPEDLAQSLPAAAQYLAEGYDREGTLEGALKYYHGGPDHRIWGTYTNAYPGQVEEHAGIALPSAESAMPQKGTANGGSDDDFINSIKLPTADVDEATPRQQLQAEAAKDYVNSNAPIHYGPSAPASVWGPGMEWGNAFLFGQGPRLAGFGAALSGGSYTTEKEQLENARDTYEAGHPLGALAANTIAPLPATVLSLAAGGEGIAALGANAARSVPALEPALAAGGRFLGGVAGAGSTGAKGLALRAASRGASGALQGGAAAVEQSGLHKDSMLEQGKQGLEVGALLNPVLAPVAEGLSSLFQKGGAAPSGSVNPVVAQTAQDASKLGVNLRGGQIAQEPHIRALDEAHVPQEANIKQLGDFHRAVSHSFGDDTDALTPQVFSDARKRIGGELDRLGSSVAWKPSQQGLTDLTDFARDLRTDMNLTGDQRALITDTTKQLLTTVKNNGGQLPGKAYAGFTSFKGPLGDLVYNKNSVVKEYGEKLRDVIDQDRERTDPSLLKAWSDARTQWKNLRIAEKWVGGSPTGMGDPTKLFNAARSISPSITSAPSTMRTLADAGKFLSTPDVTGSIKPKGLLTSVKQLLPHSPLGLTGSGLGLLGAVEAGKEVFPALASHPKEALAGLAAVAGTAAVRGGRNALLRHSLQAPEYMQRLIKGADGKTYFINPLLPPFVEGTQR